MKNLNQLKRLGACVALLLPASTFCRSALAETTLVEKDGWRFSFDGRVNAFLSVGKGDDFPTPTPNPATPGTNHAVMGSNKPPGVPDVGWKSAEAGDANNKYFAMRVRSGMIGNVLGFGLSRDITPTTSVRGYLSLWSTIETLGRDKWSAILPESREGYFSITGPWGSATVGRQLGWFGRMSTEIDYQYGHPYGAGLPCTDEIGPSCGHIGTGVAFPGYSAGFTYSTPVMGGLQINAGVYDPIIFEPEWQRAPLLRPEGAITYEVKLGGGGLLKLGAEGLYQPLKRIEEKTDPNTGAMVKSDASTSVWGGAGGARLELGPLRLGAAFFKGRGVGMAYALQKTSASLNATTKELRTFTGVYGQLALVFGKLQVAAGGGVASANQLPQDRADVANSMIKRQIGVSAAAYYHVSDSVVLGLDYFRFMARWYGAAPSVLDPATNMPVLTAGPLLPGEKQDLNFINAGVTYHW
ncbi:MAG: porin [Myxococcales bacterium]